MSEKGHSIIFPDYIIPEQISWLIREDRNKKVIYAAARPLSTFLRYNPHPLQLQESFYGLLKSTDNGRTWQKIYTVQGDIFDFVVCRDKNLYLVIVSGSGGSSGEMFIRIDSSRDEGETWFLSGEIAKNDAIEDHFKQPFIHGFTSNFIVESECNRSYILYRKDFGSVAFNSVI